MDALTFFIIVGVVALISNLANIVNNGPSAVRKLSPALALFPFIARHPFATTSVLWIILSVVFINFNTLDPQTSALLFFPDNLLGGPFSLF